MFDIVVGCCFDVVVVEFFFEYFCLCLIEWIKFGDLLLDGELVCLCDLVCGGEVVSLFVVFDI